ncbi:hypothetical protein V7166_13550 [Bacillus thuringiensis]
MNKETVIDLISKNVRLIRLEKGYSQEKMTTVLGISKKTLVQVEKERTLISWTNAVAVTSLIIVFSQTTDFLNIVALVMNVPVVFLAANFLINQNEGKKQLRI